jgi:WD40 repeat protein
LAISPNGRWVAASGISARIYVLNRSNGELYRKFFNQHLPSGLAFSPSGETLYSGCYNGLIDVWSLPQGHEIKKIRTCEEISTDRAT